MWGSGKKTDSCGLMEGPRPRSVQWVRGLVRQLTGVSHWLKWRVMVGLDWQAQRLLRLMNGAIGDRWGCDGKGHIRWNGGRKGQSFGCSMKGNSYSVRCDQRNESYFDVVPHGQKAFQLKSALWSAVRTGKPAWWTLRKYTVYLSWKSFWLRYEEDVFLNYRKYQKETFEEKKHTYSL